MVPSARGYKGPIGRCRERHDWTAMAFKDACGHALAGFPDGNARILAGCHHATVVQKGYGVDGTFVKSQYRFCIAREMRWPERPDDGRSVKASGDHASAIRRGRHRAYGSPMPTQLSNSTAGAEERQQCCA